MQKIVINDVNYELVTNYRNAYDEEMFYGRYTDYFEPYDYIVGDISYGSLRLKGFYDHSNKKAKRINDFNYLDEYLKKNCAVDCKYFVLKKGKKDEL